MNGAIMLVRGAALPPSAFQANTASGASAAGPEAWRDLCHEVRNALTTASAYSQWLLFQRSAGADERELGALLAIRESVSRALRLLDPDAPSRPAMPWSLPELVEQTVRQMPSPRNHDVRVRRLTQEAPQVCADPDVVVQIVTNLLSNATKYSPPGTPIDVELGGADGMAEMIVRDRGIGFDPVLTDAIFDGYRTPEASQMADGQGIGLRLSRRLAEEAGGRLWAASAPGRETSFHLELPMAPGL